MSDSTRKLREKNLAKFEDSGSGSPQSNIIRRPPPENPFNEISEGSRQLAAGAGFSQDAMKESPFKEDHFNSRLLGFDLGEVTDVYNKNSYIDQFNEQVDFEDLRARNQSALTKVGAAGAQFISKTALGTVGNIVGGFYGLGSAAVNWDSSKIMDNDFYRSLDEMTEAVELKNTMFVNQKDGIGFNANTAKGISDAFSFIAGAVAAETVMQTIGNVAGGSGITTLSGRLLRYSKSVGKLAKMFDGVADGIRTGSSAANKAAKAEAALDLANNVSKMSKVALIDKATKSVLEGGRRILTTTGYEASLEARGAKDDFIAASQEEMEYYLSKTNMTEGEKEMYRAKKMKQIEKDADSAGLMTFAINTGLLGLSNAIQFPQMFSSNFVKGAKLGGVVREGIGKYAEKKGKKAAFSRTMSSVGRVLKGPITEFFEETGQGVASEYAKNHYELMLGDQSNAGTLAPRANSIASSMYNALSETYGTSEGWHEGIIGAIVGAVGIPGMKKHGKGYKASWNGGVVMDFKEMQQQRKEREAALDRLNSNEMSDVVKYNRDNAIRASLDTQKEDAAAMKDNKVEFESVRDNKVFRYVNDRLEKGMGDSIEQDITEMTEMASTDIDKYKKTFQKDESFTKEDALKEIDAFKEKANIYRDAYNRVHRNYNTNIMRTDKDHKKLTDVLTYSIATGQVYTKRVKDLTQILSKRLEGKFSEEEIENYVRNSYLYKGLEKDRNDYIAEQTEKKRNKKKLSKREVKQLESEMAENPDANREEIEARIRSERKLQEGSSKPARDKKADIEAINEKLSNDMSKSMKAISKARKADVRGLENYLAVDEALRAHSQAAPDQVLSEEYDEWEDLAEMKKEFFEISDRLSTSLEVAGYLYGFKKNPQQALNAIKLSQFWADIDNIDILGKNMDALALDEDYDDEFMGYLQEYTELIAGLKDTFNEYSPYLQRTFSADDYKELKDTIKRFEDKLKEFNDKIGVTAAREKQEQEAKKATENAAKVTNPVDDKKNASAKPKPTVSEDDDYDPLSKLDYVDHADGSQKPKPKWDGDKPKTAAGSSSENPDKKDGSSTYKSANAKKANARNIKSNSLMIRMGDAWNRFHPEFATLLESGAIKDKAAVTIKTHDESKFDAKTNEGLRKALIKESSWKEPTMSGDAISVEGEQVYRSDISLYDKSDLSKSEMKEMNAIANADRMTIKKVIDASEKTSLVTLVLETDGKTDEITTLIINKPDYFRLYQSGYSKFKSNPELLKVDSYDKLPDDLYTFVRHIPLELNVHDEQLNSANDYDFDPAQQKSVFKQNYFFAAGDLKRELSHQSEQYGALNEKLNKLQEQLKKDLKKIPKSHPNERRERVRVQNYYNKLQDDAKHAFNVNVNGSFSNFNFRHTLLRRKYAAKPENRVDVLKMKVQHVDYGDFQGHGMMGDNEVGDYSPTTLGFTKNNISVDDIYYGDQNGNYIRIDGTKSSGLDVQDPFAGMQSKAVPGYVYFRYKNLAGKTLPIQMNRSKLRPDHISEIVKEIDKFWNLPVEQREKYVFEPSFIPGKTGKISMSEFMSFFMRSQKSNTDNPILLKNSFAFYSKEGKSMMSFKYGETTSTTVKTKAQWDLKKQEIIKGLTQNQWFLNKDFLVDATDPDNPKLNKPVLNFMFDQNIITHSFDVDENFDRIYAKKIGPDSAVPYKKGIRIALTTTETTKPTYQVKKSFNVLFGDLVNNLAGTKKNDKYGANTEKIIDKMTNSVVFGMSSQIEEFKQQHLRTPNDTEKKEMITAAIEKAVNTNVKKVMELAAVRGNMLKGRNHETIHKIQPGDSDLDILLRMVHSYKPLADNQYFKKSILKELENWGSNSKIFKEIQEATTPLQINKYATPEDRLMDEPSLQITSKKQFDALMATVDMLKEITDNGARVNIKYTRDYAKAKGPELIAYKDSGKGTTLSNTRARLYKVEKIGNPEFDPETNQVIGGSIRLRVGDRKEIGKGTGKYEYNTNYIVLVSSENEDRGNIPNIVNELFLPFIDRDYNITDEFETLRDSSIKRRNERDKNVSNLTNLILKTAGKTVKSDPIKNRKETEQAEINHIDLLTSEEAVKQRDIAIEEENKRNQANNAGNGVKESVTLIPSEVLENEPLLAMLDMMQMTAERFNSKRASEAEVNSYAEDMVELGITSTEQLLETIKIFKDAGYLQKHDMTALAKTIMKSVC